MRELSPFYLPFIPAKYYASLLPSYAYLLMVCCASIVVWDQTTIGLPSNDYWFAPRPHIATQLPAALFTLHSPTQCTSSPAKSPISPKRMKFFLPLVTLLLMGK